MIESLMENFEKELLLRQVQTRLKPFACDYALEASYSLIMHRI